MPKTPGGHGLGWVRDALDPRDILFAAKPPILSALPSTVDLRDKFPPIVEQSNLGSCTANAWAGAYDYERGRQNLPFMIPSRLMIYYDERVIEGSVNSDSGAQIRDGIKTLAKEGVCPENEWPYNISLFIQRPPESAYVDGLKNLALTYMSVSQTTTQMMGALAQGFPIVVGFLVFQGYENVGPNGMIPMPHAREKPLGGHANVIVGYDANRQLWITRNSWGTSWGAGGYGYFPFAYLLNQQLASDFWCVETVSAPTPVPVPVGDTFDIGTDVRARIAALGLTPMSDEHYFHNLDKSSSSITLTSGGVVAATNATGTWVVCGP